MGGMHLNKSRTAAGLGQDCTSRTRTEPTALNHEERQSGTSPRSVYKHCDCQQLWHKNLLEEFTLAVLPGARSTYFHCFSNKHLGSVEHRLQLTLGSNKCFSVAHIQASETHPGNTYPETHSTATREAMVRRTKPTGLLIPNKQMLQIIRARCPELWSQRSPNGYFN